MPGQTPVVRERPVARGAVECLGGFEEVLLRLPGSDVFTRCSFLAARDAIFVALGWPVLLERRIDGEGNVAVIADEACFLFRFVSDLQRNLQDAL